MIKFLYQVFIFWPQSSSSRYYIALIIMYVTYIAADFIQLCKFTYSIYRPETPPNTPQRARISSQNRERVNWVLESPQIRRTPHSATQHPAIPPLNFGPAVNIPILQNAAMAEDPFQMPPPAPAQYQYLPPALAQQLAALPPMPPPVHRRRRQRHQPSPPPFENYPVNQQALPPPLLPPPQIYNHGVGKVFIAGNLLIHRGLFILWGKWMLHVLTVVWIKHSISRSDSICKRVLGEYTSIQQCTGNDLSGLQGRRICQSWQWTILLEFREVIWLVDKENNKHFYLHLFYCSTKAVH